MKTIVCLLLISGLPLLADEAADRLSIERVVRALDLHTMGSPEKRAGSGLFIADAEKDVDHLPAMDPESRPPWSEVSPASAHLTIQTVRFVTADVALVDAFTSQVGAVVLIHRTPVLLVMKREGSDWRIASFRRLVANLSGLSSAALVLMHRTPRWC